MSSILKAIGLFNSCVELTYHLFPESVVSSVCGRVFNVSEIADQELELRVELAAPLSSATEKEIVMESAN